MEGGKRLLLWMMLFSFLLPPSTFLLTSCGTGDDDGRRLGEMIVGTWQRGWGEGDVVIEGNQELQPEDLAYDRFMFLDDGTYNGMVRSGSFSTTDTHGNLIFEGTYQCDNHNLKLSAEGVTILARVQSFIDDTIWLQYVNESAQITISLVIRKQ